MEGLTTCGLGSRLPRRIQTNLSKKFPSARRRLRPFLVFASGDTPELDKWDKMELKFGRLLGEDPKLTLAKIIARKDNPQVSYLDVEKSFRKGKGELEDIMINLPADSLVGEEFSSPRTQKTQDLSRHSKLNLVRPVMNKANKSKMLEEKPVFVDAQKEQLPVNVYKSTPTSNISLRKPSVFHDEGSEEDSSKFHITSNPYFKMRSSTQSSSELPVLKKPEVIQVSSKPFEESITCDSSVDIMSMSLEAMDNVDTLKKVESEDVIQQNSFERIANYYITTARENESKGTSDGLQPPMHKGVQQVDAKISSTSLHGNSINKNDVPVNASILEKPCRQEFSSRDVIHPAGSEPCSSNDKTYQYSVDVMKFQSAEEEGREQNDWRRAENLLKLGERVEVELISCSSKGFMASFGSLIGFLPYRNLSTKWKFLAFESWLKKKGLDPSLHRQNLSIMGNYVGQNENPAIDSNQNLKKDKEMSLSDMKFDELLEAYEEEKTKYLSSFVGQRLRVSVVHADKSSRRLMFSGRPKENEELVEKKRNLMERLNVGDIIKCCITKVTYFGIFVEVEGVPALVHQSEMSWDTTLDSSKYFKIGQVVEAKVHQLDFALERITLSLKEVTPDPLMESLESVIGGQTSLGENVESAQADIEWADVDSLIEELQRVGGVNNVTKGRFFVSPGLAPTFQVYMASMFDNQYKLLARYENKVQEILVQASLAKEQLKDAIMACTNRVQL